MKFSLKPENKTEIIVYVCLLIVLIGMNFVPKEVLNVFDTMIGKIISLAVIIYLGTFNLRISILVAFIYLLIIARSRKETDQESFSATSNSLSHSSDDKIQYGDDLDSPYANWQTTNYGVDAAGDIPVSSNYCVPAGSEGCKDPYKPSENDPHWCAIPNEQGGAVRCIQKCPPSACTQKLSVDNSSGVYGESVPSECPEGQVTSQDDSNFCCTPKEGETTCSCNPWKPAEGCPKYTTCGQVPQPESTEEECPYVLVKQYKCPQPEAEMESDDDTTTPEGCPAVPTCPTPTRGNDGERNNSNSSNNNRVPWLQKLNLNTTDPYIKQANTTLYKRTHPLPYQQNYDGFKILQ
jgi:hypothetical protein